jgi:hypothetical protein
MNRHHKCAAKISLVRNSLSWPIPRKPLINSPHQLRETKPQSPLIPPCDVCHEFQEPRRRTAPRNPVARGLLDVFRAVCGNLQRCCGWSTQPSIHVDFTQAIAVDPHYLHHSASNCREDCSSKSNCREEPENDETETGDSEGFRGFIGRVALDNSVTAPPDSINGFCTASHIKFCEECIKIKLTDARSRKRKLHTMLTIFLEGRPTIPRGAPYKWPPSRVMVIALVHV